MHKERIWLYLDDVRTPKDEGWTVVRNYDEFVAHIRMNGLENYEIISLDHDLGETAMIEYYTNTKPNFELEFYATIRLCRMPAASEVVLAKTRKKLLKMISENKNWCMRSVRRNFKCRISTHRHPHNCFRIQIIGKQCCMKTNLI